MEKSESKAAPVAPERATRRVQHDEIAAAHAALLAAARASREPDSPTYEPLRNMQVRYGLALGFPITQAAAITLGRLELKDAGRGP